MNQLGKIAVALAALALTPAFAADTKDLPVQATVVGTCKLGTMPTLDFGTLNQVTAPAVNPPAVNVPYRCTKNTAPSGFTVGGQSGGSFTGALSNGTDTIAYTITWTNPSTSGNGLAGTAIDVPLTGAMSGGANYQNVSAGTYTQQVPVAINP